MAIAGTKLALGGAEFKLQPKLGYFSISRMQCNEPRPSASGYMPIIMNGTERNGTERELVKEKIQNSLFFVRI